MAKFPIDSDKDTQGVVDAINYVMSGPSGLGQNFSGYSAFLPAYVRPTTRQPFSLPIDTTLDPRWYLSVPITTITTVNPTPSQLLEITFTTPFANAPFQPGDRLMIDGTTAAGGDPAFYNGLRLTVLNCSTTQVQMYYSENLYWPGLAALGGSLVRDYYDYDLSTDCNGRISIQSGTDRVFINAQILVDIDYTCTIPSTWSFRARVNRYRGTPSTTPGSTDYLFDFDTTVAERTINFSTTASGTEADIEYVFTSVLDSEVPFGYYWYILEINFIRGFTGDALPGRVVSKLRSLTAQVVKE
jgi:hypothetical protein